MFNTPSYPVEMNWAYAFPTNRLNFSYGLIAIKGSLPAFEFNTQQIINSSPAWPSNYTGRIDLTRTKQLRPNTEYLLWFLFKEKAPVDFYLALSLLPVSEIPHYLNGEDYDIPTAMGLK